MKNLEQFSVALRRMALWGLALFYLDIGRVLWNLGAGHDSFAYWWAWHHLPMYGIAPNHFGAFLYSPVFAQAIWPLAQLPWPVFFWVWTIGTFALYAWLLWPLPLRQRIPLLCLCVPQVIQGNVWPLLAVVLVFGLRRPTLWAVTFLTKVTAAMGFVWFAVRREWRPLARALATTLAFVLISAAVSPHLWTEWVHLVVTGGSASTPAFTGGPKIPWLPRLAVRLPIAIALATYGARRDRVGFLAAAVAVACPVFDFSLTLGNAYILTALPRLRAASRERSRKPVAEPVATFA